ncbi:hypothetical protein PTKIN_Ptkin15bG0184900 [Pterospermum kingtungense]
MMSTFVSVFFLLFQLIDFGCAIDNVLKVPPFNISQKSLMQYLSLDNLKIDLPAIYVFGDSFVDAGNNNFLDISEFMKTNHAPYGVDFEGKPTGRCTNGRTVVDFIAQVTGLPFPPPVLGLPKANKTIPLTGINYASAFSGIVAVSRQKAQAPDVLNLIDQIDLFENTTKYQLQNQFSSKKRLDEHLSKSLFFINIATFDLSAWEGASWYYDLDAYTQLIIDEFSNYLKRLYQIGARKFLINNANPMGCQPFKIASEKPTTACDEDANRRVRVYNTRLADLLKALQSTLPGSKFVLADLYKIFQDVYANPISYGFTDVKGICCATSKGAIYDDCDVDGPPTCKDRSKHVFFDPWNPTESMHFVWASRLLEDASVCSPISFIQLIES